jgi:hypothetical protein
MLSKLLSVFAATLAVASAYTTPVGLEPKACLRENRLMCSEGW